MGLRIALLLTLLLPGLAAASTFDVVLAGKKCQEDSTQQLNCVFTIGKDLRIDLAGIGTDATSATFMRSNFNGDYYATLGTLHGCIIVKPGGQLPNRASAGFAFISPRSAKVFKDWQDCKGQ